MSLDSIIDDYAAARQNADPSDTPSPEELTAYRTALEAIDAHLAADSFASVGYLDFPALNALLHGQCVEVAPERLDLPGAHLYLVDPKELLAQHLLDLVKRANEHGDLSPADLLEYAAEVLPHPAKEGTQC